MKKEYRPWAPLQGHVLPPNPVDWLPKGHLVHFVIEVVERLDLGGIEIELQSKDWRGTRSFHPRMMTALLLYGYCVGVVSSRRLERATYEDLGLRVLAAGEHPDHTRISEFRRKHLKVLAGLFTQVLHLCQSAGLVKLGHVSLDGSKFQANASKHKAMSHERMKRSTGELRAEVDELMRRAEEADRAEDALFGKDKRGDELPAELQRRETRLAKIEEAMAKLEAEAAAAKARERAEQAEQAKRAAEHAAANEREAAEQRAAVAQEKAKKAAEKAKEKAKAAQQPEPVLSRDPEDVPTHQVKADAEGDPDPKAQRNFTDPDSRIMKGSSGGFVQGYNGQIAVDDAHQIIVGQFITNQAPDCQHLAPMLTEIAANCGEGPRRLSADAGYWSEDNAARCEARDIDAYIATGRLKHGEAPTAAAAGTPPADLDAKARMAHKLRTEAGHAVYSRRKTIVEPVFGQIKHIRGIRQLLLRGIEKVRGEWALICTGHNLLKLYRAALAGA